MLIISSVARETLRLLSCHFDFFQCLDCNRLRNVLLNRRTDTACSTERTDSATQCWTARSVSDWIVLEWELYYFILYRDQAPDNCSFEQLLARVNRTQTIILRQVIDLSATATTIKSKLYTLLWAYVLSILAHYIL